MRGIPKGKLFVGVNEETSVEELDAKRKMRGIDPSPVRKAGVWELRCVSRNGFGEGEYVVLRNGKAITEKYSSMRAAEAAFHRLRSQVA